MTNGEKYRYEQIGKEHQQYQAYSGDDLVGWVYWARNDTSPRWIAQLHALQEADLRGSGDTRDQAIDDALDQAKTWDQKA